MLLATKLRFALTATVLKRMNGDLSPFGMVLCLRIPGRGFWLVSVQEGAGTVNGPGGISSSVWRATMWKGKTRAVCSVTRISMGFVERIQELIQVDLEARPEMENFTLMSTTCVTLVT